MTPIEITKSWIEKFVIGLNICPFAANPFQKEKIRFRLDTTNDLEKLVESLEEELLFLQNKTPEEVETSILIHPNILNNFLDYNDFLSMANEILIRMGLEGEIQIASFHPNYQFGGVHKDAISNYVTRSPYPMLHFLREESVEKAIERHPDTQQIPFENIRKLEDLGLEGIERISKS